MTVQVQRYRALKYQAKKAKSNVAFSNSHSTVVVGSISRGKSAALSHNDLRKSTLKYHPGKFYNSIRAWHTANQRLAHGVELTDDVIIIGQNEQRVPPPDYATLRIDQLPQFRKK